MKNLLLTVAVCALAATSVNAQDSQYYFRFLTDVVPEYIAPSEGLSGIFVSIPVIYEGDTVSPFSAMLAEAGIGHINWSLTGNLPSGMSFGSDGMFSGTPSSSGDYSFTLRAFDELDQAAVSPTITMRVHSLPTVPADQVLNGVTGEGVSVPITPSGGVTPYTVSWAEATYIVNVIP